MTEITATEAARGFSDLLDRVERRGQSFTVVRKGRPVAQICPAGPRSITVGELLELLRGAPQPDGRFADDVAEARQRIQSVPLRDPWASS